MKTSLLPWAAAALFLAGCATLSDPERNVLRQHRVSAQLYAKMEHRERISLPDVMELSEKRVPPPFILSYLRSTYAVYRLTSDDVIVLRNAGVNRQVIDYLLATPTIFAPSYDPWWYADDLYWWDYPTVFVSHGHHSHHDHR